MADKYYYNGVLLPEIPADVLTTYQHYVIYCNSAGTRFLLAGPHIWWMDRSAGKLFTNAATTYTRYSLSDDESVWEAPSSWYDNGALPCADIVWSNRNIPDGAADATEIYFYGSEPVAEDATSTEVYYRVSSTRMTGLADQARRLGNVTGELTPAQIEETLSGVTVGGSGGSMFTSSAVCILPTIHKGYANSELTLDFESTAVCVLQE